MRPEELDIQQLMALIEEVADVLNSSSLLNGSETKNFHEISFGDNRVYGWKVVDLSDYLSSINIENEDTPYLDLNEILGQVRSSYHFFRSYSPIHVTDEAIEKNGFGQIHKLISSSNNAQRFIDILYRADDQKQDRAQYLDHVLNTASNHFHAILYSRITTLSRRFPVTESLLDAYASGLVPFGWSYDDDCVLCVRPTALV